MKTLTTLVGVLALATLSHAQNNVSWVASTGNDSNTCVRTSPCRTFQVAYSKTNPGGVIHAVDAADYGELTISKSLTLDGGNSGAVITGILGTALTLSSAAEAVNIRNLTIHQLGGPLSGILMLLAGSGTVNIENVAITTVVNTRGISIQSNGSDSGAATQVNLRNVSINGFGTGVSTLIGQLTADRLSTNVTANGVWLTGNWVNATFRDSVFHTPGGNGVLASSDINSQITRSAMFERCEFALSTQGLTTFQSPQGSPIVVKISNSVFANNVSAIGQDGGTVISYRNNAFSGNIFDGNPPLTTSFK